MGHTMTAANELLANELDALSRMRRALRAEDQVALDSLFNSSRHNIGALALASKLLPFEAMLLSMLLEEHKRVDKLQRLIGKAAGQTQDEMDLYDAA